MTLKKALIVLAAVAMASGANAATIMYDFGTPSGDLGHSHTYTDIPSGLSIIATGYDNLGHLTDLWGKNGTGDENGLGMANDPTGDHEIHYGMGFVQLDVSKLFGKVKAASTDFGTNSTTSGEEWGIYGSNIAGSFSGSPLIIGTIETTHLLPDFGLYKYYDFKEMTNPSGQGDNFLIHDLTTARVPEPATWAMLLVGFAALGAALRARRAAAAAC
jgi:hypothetical protein